MVISSWRRSPITSRLVFDTVSLFQSSAGRRNVRFRKKKTFYRGVLVLTKIMRVNNEIKKERKKEQELALGKTK